MKNKRPEIDPEIAKQVQVYANKHHDDNFTKAIDRLVRDALAYLKKNS